MTAHDPYAEIRRKVETLALGMRPPLWSPGAEYARDVPLLLAAVDELNAEVARLRRANEQGCVLMEELLAAYERLSAS